MAKRAWEASSSRQGWLPEVLPEHTIFLSHSGHDKPFVERLCEKLEECNHSPFFDQNSDSFPKGERFPPHIFKAAEQCLLTVIVLSEGYLTSKWPMLELAAFVKARETKNPRMKLLPLFYKLPPSDLVPEKWIESWKKLAADEKIHAKEIELWSQGVEVLMKAKNIETERLKSLTELDEHDEIMLDDFPKLLAEVVKDLRPFNGLEFSKYGTSERRYIEAVVDEICEIIPPMMKYSIDGILGYQRICEKASSLFEEGSLTNDVCKPGCFYLGLYGMGGVGKTTLCEALCNFHQVEFHGRVCHVELQSDASDKRIERLKHVIRQLGGLNDRVVEMIKGESQVLQCLKDRLKRQPRAFLAVDNVGDSESSREGARRFISCGLACGSKVMVTSRSRIILESVLRADKYCKPIPRLEEQEAEELFLSVAIPQKILSPLHPSEDVIVKACVQECKFLDDGYDTQQYHPLVLRAMGTFFHDVDKDDILEWEEALMFEKKVKASRESKHVNDILGLNYANLSDGQKLLFLDVVFLFNHENSLMHLVNLWSYCEHEYQWSTSLIAAMHGISTFEADFEVEKLQRKSLIYESSPTLRTHDLYIEFAQSMVAMEGSKEHEWWVGHRDANGYNPGLKRLLLFEDKSKIGHPPKQLWKCPNLEFLFMDDCLATLNSKLDLKCFPNLRVLRSDDPTEIATLRCNSDGALGFILNYLGWKDRSKGCLPELRMVRLRGFDFRRISFLRECWNLTFLHIHDFDFEILDYPQYATSLFENLKALQTLILSSKFYGCQFPSHVYDGILQCATTMKNLKFLEIDRGISSLSGYDIGKLDLSPLGRATSLKTLSLPCLPDCIKELVGLDQLSQLIELNLWHCRGLRKLANLDLLPNLQRICVADCWDLNLADTNCWDLNHAHNQLKRFQKFHSRSDSDHQCLKY